MLRYDSGHPDGGKAVMLPSDLPPSSTPGKFPLKFMFTATRILLAETFNIIMSEFKNTWQVLNHGRACVVLMDNLGIHYQPQLIIDLAKEFVYVFFFVEYTSHWSQPLDSSPFAN